MSLDTVAVGVFELSDAELESIRGGWGPWGPHRREYPFFNNEEEENNILNNLDIDIL